MNEFRASIFCNQNKSFLEFKMFQLFRDAVNLIESLKFDSGSFVSKMSDCATLYLFISEDKKIQSSRVFIIFLSHNNEFGCIQLLRQNGYWIELKSGLLLC